MKIIAKVKIHFIKSIFKILLNKHMSPHLISARQYHQIREDG